LFQKQLEMEGDSMMLQGICHLKKTQK